MIAAPRHLVPLAPWAIAFGFLGVVTGGCGDGTDPAQSADAGATDAPLASSDAEVPDASVPDAGMPDAGGDVDAFVRLNPPRLWLHGVNGSERNLELIPEGPPAPF